MLKLAIKSPKAPLVGEVRVVAKMRLPPGGADVPERIELDDRFDLVQATFTNYNVQRRINTLSSKGKGDEEIGCQARIAARVTITHVEFGVLNPQTDA